jgi:sec-independent protein translocase protein TatB
MFEVGFWELALIFVIGLLVLGPEKLPKVAAQLGRYAGQARRMARTLTTQIRDEIEAEERRITASESKAAAPKPSYSRPGADDLIPRTAAERETDATPTPTDAGDEPTDRPEPQNHIPAP